MSRLADSAAEEIWRRLDHLCSLLENAVRVVRRGVGERKGHLVSMGLIGISSSMPEALRMLGRVDQVDEYKDERQG